MSVIPMPEGGADLERELTDCREALTHAKQRLVEQEKLVALGTLVPGLSHDISTPIGIAVTAASGASESAALLTKKLSGEKVSRTELLALAAQMATACTLVNDNLQRAAELIASFKILAVDQASELESSLDLADYLRRVVRVHQPALRSGRVEVRLDAPPRLDTMIAGGLFSQIVSNLLMNAVVHAFEGIDERYIKLRLWTEGQRIFLRHADSGRGASGEVRERLFEPLFTTRRGSGGSGLGLHIADSLSRKLGGHIALEPPKDGEGLSFLLELPLRN
jgi:C4-dicarboxylate-specific signal transduction histidine kinase